MNTINQIIQDPSIFSFYSRMDYADNNPILIYNENSDYVPFYAINKFNYQRGCGMVSDSIKPIYLKVQNLSTFNKNVCNYNFNLVKDSSKITCEKYLKDQINIEINKVFISNDFNIYRTRQKHSYYTNQFIKHNSTNELCRIQRDSIEYFYRNNFLLDVTNGKVLYSLVIKKEYLDIVRYMMILNEEVPIEYFELWVRKDFINDPKYLYFYNQFRRDLLNPCLVDNIEVQILDDFSPIFNTLKLPKVRSIKAQKEVLSNMCKEFLEYKRKLITPSSKSVWSTDVQKGLGLRAQILNNPVIHGISRELHLNVFGEIFRDRIDGTSSLMSLEGERVGTTQDELMSVEEFEEFEREELRREETSDELGF